MKPYGSKGQCYRCKKRKTDVRHYGWRSATRRRVQTCADCAKEVGLYCPRCKTHGARPDEHHYNWSKPHAPGEPEVCR